MAHSSPALVRHQLFIDCSKTNVPDALADLVLALLAEDTADNTLNPVDYILTRIAALIGRDHVAYKHFAELTNNLRDKYAKAVR